MNQGNKNAHSFAVKNPFHRLQTIEYVPQETFLTKSLSDNHQNAHTFLINNPFQNYQTYETAHPNRISYHNNYSNPRVPFQLNGQTIPLNRLQSIENASPPNTTSSVRYFENNQNFDFGLVSQMKIVNAPQKLKNIEEAPKINKISNRSIVPPIRQGGVKNTFQLPTLRQTNNEYIIDALKNQPVNATVGGINYYLSPYLAGYLKK